MRSKYSTKAREAILNHLKEKEGQHLTVKDVYDYFGAENNRIGKTTIYRQLDEFVKEGIVKRCVVDGGGATFFEYVGTRDDASDNYHVKCESCGRLVHLQCKEVSELWNHLLEKHSFKMNPQMTVIYGQCGNCISKNEKLSQKKKDKGKK